jgi:hypothetical protein
MKEEKKIKEEKTINDKGGEKEYLLRRRKGKIKEGKNTDKGGEK